MQLSEVDQPVLALVRRAGASLRRVSRYGAAAISLAWMVLIWLLSSISATDSSALQDVPGLWLNAAHAGEFGLLALWFLLLAPRTATWVRTGRRELGLVFVGVLAFGLLDEWHQSFVPGRHPTYFDLFTDATGAACVLWIVTYAGSARATESGLRRRLVLSVAFCLFAAWTGTAYHTRDPAPLWFGLDAGQ